MYRTSNAGVIDTYIYIYTCTYIYIYICAYFCTYLDLYNVSLQGNRIQTYSICTLLHLLIKEASQKSQPIHFLLSSCAIYTEKYCAYIHIYIYIHSIYICTYTIEKLQNQQCWHPIICCVLNIHLLDILK